MTTLTIFVLAALAEIAGCFAFWMVLRQGASALLLIPGAFALLAFAWLLTRTDVAFAGRAFAIYGGIYIATSLVWLWRIEGKTPDQWDLLGAGICLAGALVILYGPRAA